MNKRKMQLDKVPLNKEAKVCELYSGGDIRRRMLDLGIIKGTEIVPVLKSPFGNLKAYEIRGSIIALRQEDSKLIKVEEMF